MIEARGLTKAFNRFVAVDDVSLSVEPGQVLALLGPNGAGKTTTVRMLCSILRPTSGSARVAGFDVVAEAAAVRARVGMLTEHHGLYLRASGREYLEFYGDLYQIPRDRLRRRLGELLERFGMAYAADRRIGEYSKGMRQKLALIRAMLHDPPVLLLDEPTSAMDPHSARLVRDAIQELRSDNRSIMLCTHNLTEAEQLSDQIAIIRRGRIIAHDSATQLKGKLLGPAQMRLSLAQPLDGLAELLADLVEVINTGDDWLEYCTADPVQTNPKVLARLSESSLPVVTLAEVPRSLEAVYLQVVESSDSQDAVA
ncbi:MAG: ABC transporter ATP-binding protein [Anaerolineales bacterium]